MYSQMVTPTGIIQFKQLLGVEKIVSRKTGREIGITKGGGQALYDAAKARWMFNTFIKSFRFNSFSCR
jgi:hypothetical protein